MNYTILESSLLGEKCFRMHHPSGLTIILCPKEGYNTTYASIGTKFGSIYTHFRSRGRDITVPDGTAHYLEHKLFESEDGDAFSKYAKTGAQANAYTSFDMTCYLFECTDNFRESLEILIDLIRSPYFTDETVAKEQGIIGQEIKMYDDNADWRVLMNLLSAMYQNHPINTDIAGSVKSIAEITPEVLYDCYNSYYNLNNMVMCIAGKVDPDEVLEIADRMLTPDGPFETETIMPEEPYEVAKKKVTQQLPVAVPMFAIGFKEHSTDKMISSKDYICTSIIMEAFAGIGSPLYRELTDLRLANSTFAFEYSEGIGYNAVIFSGETHKPEEAAAYIVESVRKLHETGISPELFEEAKKCVYGQLVSSFDNPGAIASAFIAYEFTGRDRFAVIEEAASVTIEDVNSRLSHQLDPDNCSLSLITGCDT